jgi:hypothetical protein
MHQHADHRPPLAAAPILAARGFLLHHPGFLQHQSQPVVRDLHAVLLGDVFVKMAQREIGINVAFEPAEQLDGAGLDALAARPPAALVHHRRHAPAFDLAP